MSSSKHGISISEVEVSHVSNGGIWLFVREREYFLPYAQYPWFKNAKLSQIQNVELIHGYHLYWKDLDIDLEIKSIESPGQYPPQYR